MPEERLVDNPSLPFRLRPFKEREEVPLHGLQDAPAVGDHPPGPEGLADREDKEKGTPNRMPKKSIKPPE